MASFCFLSHTSYTFKLLILQQQNFKVSDAIICHIKAMLAACSPSQHTAVRSFCALRSEAQLNTLFIFLPLQFFFRHVDLFACKNLGENVSRLCDSEEHDISCSQHARAREQGTCFDGVQNTGCSRSRLETKLHYAVPTD